MVFMQGLGWGSDIGVLTYTRVLFYEQSCMVLHSGSQSPRVLNSATGVTNKIQNQSIKQQKFTKGPLWQTIEYTELHTLHPVQGSKDCLVLHRLYFTWVFLFQILGTWLKSVQSDGLIYLFEGVPRSLYLSSAHLVSCFSLSLSLKIH